MVGRRHFRVRLVGAVPLNAHDGSGVDGRWAPLRLRRQIEPTNPFGYCELSGTKAVAMRELILDHNQWHTDNVTGITREVLEAVEGAYLRPNSPVTLNLPGRIEHFSMVQTPGSRLLREEDSE